MSFVSSFLLTALLANGEDVCTTLKDDAFSGVASARTGEVLLQKNQVRESYVMESSPVRSLLDTSPARNVLGTSPVRRAKYTLRESRRQGYQGSPNCVPPNEAEEQEERERHMGLLSVSAEVSIPVNGATTGLDAEGFKQTTSLCCPSEMETFFNRLLQAQGYVVCSKAHIQGLMHWFTCVPDMDFQYVLDIIENGNPCKYWARDGESCSISAQCLGHFCNMQTPPTEPPPMQPMGQEQEETTAPTEPPTEQNEAPTEPATEAPAELPTDAPTEAPTEATSAPTEPPTPAPTEATSAPTEAPTPAPTPAPTEAPTTTTGTTTTATSTTITTTTSTRTTSTTTTTTSTTSTTTLTGCEGDVELKFWSAHTFHSNLNSLGPMDGEEGVRIAGLGEHNGQEFDLFISSTTPRYESQWAGWNGLDGLFGYLTMNNNSGMDLEFKIVKTGSDELFPLPKFYFTFFDLDTSHPYIQGGGAERLVVSGFEKYLLGPDTELDVSTNADGQTVFQATVWGETADNPSEPLKLNTQQKNRAVTLLFENTAKFEVTYECLPNGGSRGREVFFAGKSQLSTDPCGGPEGRQPARSVNDHVPNEVHKEIADHDSPESNQPTPTPPTLPPR